MTDLTDPPARLRSVSATPRYATFRAIGALVLREMSTAYGRSPGGYVWAVLEPSITILVLATLFSLGFRTPPIGENFAIFMATGFLPFFLYLEVSNKTAQAINFSKQLLNYPRVTFLDAILARFLLTIITRVLVSYIIFAFILTVFETRTILDLPRIVLSFTAAACLGLGVGMMNAVLITRFPLWQMFWGICTRPLIFLSNVIFLIESFPEPYSTWLEWNPLVHVTAMMRSAFYYSYHPDYLDIGYVFLVAAVPGVMGLLFLRRWYRDFLER